MYKLNLVTWLTWLAILLQKKTLANDEGKMFRWEESSQLFDYLINVTNYDKRIRPTPRGPFEPVEVRTSMFVYFLGHINDRNTEFDVHFLIRHRWQDLRLRYSNLTDGEVELIGEDWYANNIWTPNIFIGNEMDTKVMAMNRDSVFVRIESSGVVSYDYRIRTTVICDMNLRQFPHDTQICHMALESWTFKENDLILKWETPNPFDVRRFTMSEYNFTQWEVWEAVTTYRLTSGTPRMEQGLDHRGMGDSENSLYGGDISWSSQHGHDDKDIPWSHINPSVRKSPGNFSMLLIKFELKRQVEHYIVDYYVPSCLLVVISWVAFYLSPDAVPGRTTLGTATWLTFITLHKGTRNDLPKLNYIILLDVWFLVCTIFIFLSLLQFAFVNMIWRRKEKVNVSMTSSSIIREGFKEFSRSSLSTPTWSRKNSVDVRVDVEESPHVKANGSPPPSYRKHSFFNYLSRKNSVDVRDHVEESPNLEANGSPPLSYRKNSFFKQLGPTEEIVLNQLKQNDIIIKNTKVENVKKLTRKKPKISKIFKKKNKSIKITINSDEHEEKSVGKNNKKEDMAYEEIAVFIDTRARIFFPLLFFLFVILYFTVMISWFPVSSPSLSYDRATMIAQGQVM